MADAQVSFPKVNAPLTAEEWASVTLGIGNGTLDEGSGNYRITFDDALDQCIVSPRRGVGMPTLSLLGSTTTYTSRFGWRFRR